MLENKLITCFRDRLLLDEDLSTRCHYEVGGRARYFLFPDGEQDLVTALELARQHDLPYFILGNGTNVLFSDRGFNGLIISMTGSFKQLSLQDDGVSVLAGAGVGLQDLIDWCIQHSLGGLEKLSGIPGSVGGALRMNAGSYGTDISSRLEGARILGEDARFHDVPASSLGLSYRHSTFKGVAVSAAFNLERQESQALESIKHDVLRSRASRHPLDFPSAGSVFKKTDDGVSAGALIDQAGLKGKRIGNAVISGIHANFILNVGGATAGDIVALARLAQEKVHREFSVLLKPELVFVGFERIGDGGLPESESTT